MKKLIKILLGLLVACVTLVIAAVVILPMVVSPNDYKPQILEVVKQQTGRDLSIEGDIGLSVFPKIGLKLGRTSLSNAPGFGKQAFASMDAVNIQVALMPLLDKQVEMDEVVLQGLSLNLQRNQAGKTNWDDIAQPAEPVAEKKAAAGASQLESIVIGGVRIENANILWQDEQQDQRFEINDFNLLTGALSGGNPVDIELKTRFASRTPEAAGQLGFTGVVQADLDGSQYTLSDIRFTLDASGETLPGGQAGAAVNASQLVVNLKEQTLSLTSLALDVLGLTVTGGINGTAIMGDSPQFNGKLAINQFNARDVIKTLGQAVPETSDVNALTQVNASFDLAATSNSARLSNLSAQLDETNLKGVLAITDFNQQAITFDLTIDQIDLDRYLPADDASAKSGQTDPQAELFPVETLRQLNANGTARIGTLKKMNLTVTDIVVKVKAGAGKVNLKPSASLYEGKYDADVTVDASRATPTLNVGADLVGVQIEPLLKDMQGEARLAGTTDAKVNITAVGNTQAAVKKTLNGNANFSFKDGALVGVNIARIIREGLAKLNGKSVPSSNQPEKTDFSSLSGTAKITNGVVNNQDFKMQSPLLRITGAGKANLVQEDLNYLLKASVVGSLQGQGGEELKQLKGITIPVRVSGPFSDPSYKPDLSAALELLSKVVFEQVESSGGLII